MVSKKLKNIATKDFRKFLKKIGCKYIRHNGSHEVYARHDLKRPIVLPGNKKEVKEYVIKNTLNNLGITEDEFWDVFSSKKGNKFKEDLNQNDSDSDDLNWG